MVDFVCGIFAMMAYTLMVAAYISIRPKKALSIMDMFMIMFSLQFGPHAIIKHPFLESALWVPDIYPAYALGLALAYFGLAVSLFLGGTIFRTRAIRLYPVQGTDLARRHVPALFCIALLYIFFFIAVQGFDLSRTTSYLNFFKGSSTYTYTELRRELYNDDAALGLAAVTRQTSSALIFGALIYAGIKFSKWRAVLFATALGLFVVCCLQMNKFPVLYYSVVTGLIVYADGCYKTGRFITRLTVIKVGTALLAFILLLSTLYMLQYGREIDAGIVTGEKLLFRLISRPFAGNHDSLYLWFANFPDYFDFIGFANVPALASLFGLNHFSPTVEIPALYVSVTTTFQAGYIGGAYASFGYPGIFVYSLFVGALVVFLTRYEARLDVRWQRVVFFSVMGMNCYFVVSRELHTALQSGGLLLAPLMLMAFRAARRVAKGPMKKRTTAGPPSSQTTTLGAR